MMSLLFAGLVATSSSTPSYPPEWWAPVPESEKESWEILPQEAAPGEVILSKRTELGVFSNLAPTPVVFERIVAATRAKLEQNPAVKALLLRTRGLKLRMDHHIEETFPAYQTAQILMQFREEFSAPKK